MATVNATQSFTDYRVGVDVPGEYKVVLSSDEKKFGGHDRIALDGKYFTTPMGWNGRNNWLQVSTIGLRIVAHGSGLFAVPDRIGIGTVDLLDRK